MSVSLATPTLRLRLAASHAPYWHKVTRGISVGYRNKTSERPTWYARIFMKGEGYVTKAIGAADDRTPADGKTTLTWKEAVSRALSLNPAQLREQGRSGQPKTVLDAGVSYFTHRRARSRSQRSVDQDHLRWRVYVLPELGDHVVEKITTGDLRRWFDEIVTKAEADTDLERQRRAQATANRVWTILRAVLNFAFESGDAPSDTPWRRINPYENVDRPRTRFLTVPEAMALLTKLDPEFSALAKGALYTGLRLGELLALTRADVGGNQVHVRTSKTGVARHVPLSPEGTKFFGDITKDRAAEASVFGLVDTPAMRVRLSRKMRAACKAAGIPAAVFHDLRRSYGSLLLNSGASMDQISVALGHADLRMTRRTYAHLSQANLATAIKKHLPSFNGTTRPRKQRSAKRGRR